MDHLRRTLVDVLGGFASFLCLWPVFLPAIDLFTGSRTAPVVWVNLSQELRDCFCFSPSSFLTCFWSAVIPVKEELSI